jgi:hypothetical protein
MDDDEEVFGVWDDKEQQARELAKLARHRQVLQNQCKLLQASLGIYQQPELSNPKKRTSAEQGQRVGKHAVKPPEPVLKPNEVEALEQQVAALRSTHNLYTRIKDAPPHMAQYYASLAAKHKETERSSAALARRARSRLDSE